MLLNSFRVREHFLLGRTSRASLLNTPIQTKIAIVLFPEIADIAVTRAIVSNVDTRRLDTLNVAIVRYSKPMNKAQSDKFLKYLEARLSTKSIKIVPTN